MRQSLYKYAGGHRTGANVLRRVFGLGGSVDTPHTPKRRPTGGGGDVPRTPTHIKYKVSPELQDFFAGKSEVLTEAGVKEFKKLLKQETGQEYAIFLDKNRRVVAAVRQMDVQYAKERGLKSADIVSIARKSGNADNFDTAFLENVDAVVKSRKSTPNAPKPKNIRSPLADYIQSNFLNEHGVIPHATKLPEGVTPEALLGVYNKLRRGAVKQFSDDDMRILNAVMSSRKVDSTDIAKLEKRLQTGTDLDKVLKLSNPPDSVQADTGVVVRGKDGALHYEPKSLDDLVHWMENAVDEKGKKLFAGRELPYAKYLRTSFDPIVGSDGMPLTSIDKVIGEIGSTVAKVNSNTLGRAMQNFNFPTLRSVPAARKHMAIFGKLKNRTGVIGRVKTVLQRATTPSISTTEKDIRTLINNDPSSPFYMLFNPASGYRQTLNPSLNGAKSIRPAAMVPMSKGFRLKQPNDWVAYNLATALKKGDISLKELNRVTNNLKSGGGMPAENMEFLRKIYSIAAGKDANTVSINHVMPFKGRYPMLLNGYGRVNNGYNVLSSANSLVGKPFDPELASIRPWLKKGDDGKFVSEISPEVIKLAELKAIGVPDEILKQSKLANDFDLLELNQFAGRLGRFEDARLSFGSSGSPTLLDLRRHPQLIEELQRKHPLLKNQISKLVGIDQGYSPNMTVDDMIKRIPELNSKQFRQSFFDQYNSYRNRTIYNAYYNNPIPQIKSGGVGKPGTLFGRVKQKAKKFGTELRSWPNRHRWLTGIGAGAGAIGLGTHGVNKLWEISEPIRDVLGNLANPGPVPREQDANGKLGNRLFNPLDPIELEDEATPDYSSGWWKAGGALGGAILAPWLVSSLLPKNSKGGFLDTLLTIAAIGGGAYGGYKLGEWGHDTWGKQNS